MMNVGSLFSGIGGLELGLEQTGHFKVKWQVEIDPFANEILKKHWPDVKRFSDVREFHPTGEDMVVDLICGGFPCVDVSNAKTAQEGGPQGLKGAQSGLWFQYLRVVREARPRWVLVENVGALSIRGLGTVLWGLASEGYDAEWATISAASLGASHLRKRLFIVARVQDPDRKGLEGPIGQILAQPRAWRQDANAARSAWRDAEPAVGRVADGLPKGVDGTGKPGNRKYPKHTKGRLKALGNAVVPAIARFIGDRIFQADHAYCSMTPASASESHPRP